MLIHSESEMMDYGKAFAKRIAESTVIELVGDVGAGKTTFVRGLAQGLGISEPLSSPSFTISRAYQGEKFLLVHYDFYRLNDPGLMAEDLAESVETPNCVTVIEWGQSVAECLPEKRHTITIKYIDENTREITEQ